MSYTECRMSRIAEEMLADLDKDTVNLVDNFDGSLKEPSVLPGQAAEPTDQRLRRYRRGHGHQHAASQPIRGGGRHRPCHRQPRGRGRGPHAVHQGARLPDRRHDLRHRRHHRGIQTGRGKVKVRAKTSMEERDGGGSASSSMRSPTRSTSPTSSSRIAELVKDKQIEGITDLRDESDRDGMRIVIELRRDVIARDRAQPLVQAHPDGGDLRRHQPRAGQQRAQGAHAEGAALALSHLSQGGRDPPHPVRPGRGQEARAHPASV